MAVAVNFEIPGGTQEQYEEVSRRAFGSAHGPSEPIPGLIIHTAGATGDGWRVFDVWESKDAFMSFMEETMMPATEGMDMPQNEPEIYELHNMVGATMAQTT